MSLEHAILILEQRLAETRIYQAPIEDFYSPITSEFEGLQEVYSDVVGTPPIYSQSSRLLSCSDMCARGPGGQFELAAKWGLCLPGDYAEFCKKYATYIFGGKASIHIMDAADIEEVGTGVRDGWNMPRGAQHRLFYFAQVLGEPAHFAFRWGEDQTMVDIVFSWDYGDIGEPVLLGSDGDRFVCDQDFTSWLSRLLKTDGYPSFPAERVPMASGWIDRDWPGLVRVE